MSDPGCFWHGAEPVPRNAYKVCLECGHAWPTEEAFRESVLADYVQVGEDPPADLTQVDVCPLCTHDF